MFALALRIQCLDGSEHLEPDYTAKEYPCVAALRDHPHMVRETLSPGDVLFIPCGWFHQVRYVNEASVSVTVIASHPQATAEGLSVATCAKHTRPL